MISQLWLEDFKSFQKLDISLAPLTFVVGANGSGKSNLIEALRLYQAALSGLSWAEALEGNPRREWPGVRGGVAKAAYAEGVEFCLCPSWHYQQTELRHCLTVDLREELPMSKAEWLRLDSCELYDSKNSQRSSAGAIQVTCKSQGQGRPHRQELAASGYLGRKIVPNSRIAPEVWDALNYMHHQAEQWLFLEPQPSKMRDYCFEGLTQLGSHGENISAILNHLTQGGKKGDLVDWLGELVGPEVSDLEFERNSLRQVMFTLVEQEKLRTPAASVSDGTLRFLAIACALLTQPAPSLLMMEEIDLGLHPSRLQTLCELLVQTTEGSGRQVIATTHSPQLLAALPREHLLNVVLCARTPQTEGTVVRRLSDLPHFEEILQRRQIEYLMTTQWLERALP